MPRPSSLNPEAHLQASLARDIKIRVLEDHVKKQNVSLSVAKWEQKQIRNERKASSPASTSTLNLFNNNYQPNNKNYSVELRRKKIEELFLQDELRYEEELNQRNLTYRRERI